MKNDYLKSFLVLLSICIVVALLMGLVNYFTASIIENNEKQKTEEALKEVMPDGLNFERVSVEGLPSTVKQVYKEDNGGYVFKLVTNGYGTGLTVICGIDASGKITGCKCIESNETLGKEKTYGDVFYGLDIDGVSGVDTVSGATLTTRAYKKAVSEAVSVFKTLTGKAGE
ncbi:MAG: FMN-binding protein [Clostridia bacterium]|nr:FMN-binding protein [Clostridia bacterium]